MIKSEIEKYLVNTEYRNKPDQSFTSSVKVSSFRQFEFKVIQKRYDYFKLSKSEGQKKSMKIEMIKILSNKKNMLKTIK